MVAQCQGFFALPAELRLVVYSYLADSTLAIGYPSSISGFYLSCKEIREEMEIEIVSKMQRLLEIQHRWNTVIQIDAPLRISVPGSRNSMFSLGQFTLRVPISSAWDPRSPNNPDSEDFKRLTLLLLDLLRLQTSILSIKFYYVSGGEDLWYRASEHVALTLFNYIGQYVKSSFALRQIDRLILPLGPSGCHADIELAQSCLSSLWAWITRNCVAPKVERAWALAEETLASEGRAASLLPTWTVGFDFKICQSFPGNYTICALSELDSIYLGLLIRKPWSFYPRYIVDSLHNENLQ